MSSINEQIESRVRPVVQERIRQFVGELTEELTVLVRQAAAEIVSQTLGADGPPTRGAGRSRGAGRTRGAPAASQPQTAANGSSRIRRSPRQLAQQSRRLREHVEKHPGERMEQIATALGSSTKELRRPMQQLIDDGAVRREGERRASRYFPPGEGSKAQGPKRKPSKGKASRKGRSNTAKKAARNASAKGKRRSKR